MSAAITITGVDFATVFVKDYPAAVEFYSGILGLEHSVDYGKIPAREVETGNLTLQLLDAAAIGREFVPSSHPIAFHVEDVEATRAELEFKGRQIPRRHDGQRRLPHGSLHRPRRQRPDAPPPLRPAGLSWTAPEKTFARSFSCLRLSGLLQET